MHNESQFIYTDIEYNQLYIFCAELLKHLFTMHELAYFMSTFSNLNDIRIENYHCQNQLLSKITIRAFSICVNFSDKSSNISFDSKNNCDSTIQYACMRLCFIKSMKQLNQSISINGNFTIRFVIVGYVNICRMVI